MVDYSEKELEWIRFFVQESNEWHFRVFKLIVVSESGKFWRASLFRQVNPVNLIEVRSKSLFDVFLSKLLRDGLLLHGEKKSTENGFEIPLLKTVSAEKVFKAVLIHREDLGMIK